MSDAACNGHHASRHNVCADDGSRDADEDDAYYGILEKCIFK
jgi:hypothetical protein